jgi:drug/metabolite transporter (DMT)-like permease
MRDDESDPYAQTVLFTGLVGMFALVILLFQGGGQNIISLNQLPIFVLITGLSAIGGLLTFKGFKHIEASEHVILLTSSRLWSVAGAIVILGEVFTLRKLLGAGAIIIGVVVTEWQKHKFVINRGALYVLLAAACYAIAEIFSFYILRDFDSTTFLVYVAFFIVIAMLVLRPKTITKFSFYKKPTNLANILMVTISDTAANLSVFRAYQVGRNALQIGPLLATQTIVTVILAVIILKETRNLTRKIVGGIVVVIGTILLL